MDPQTDKGGLFSLVASCPLSPSGIHVQAWGREAFSTNVPLLLGLLRIESGFRSDTLKLSQEH